MSARDVDLEFEQAYQRLFSTSAAPTGAGRSTSTSSEPRAESSQAPHLVDNDLRSWSTSAAPSRGDRSRQPHGLDALPPLAGKSWLQERAPRVQQTQRERPSQARSLQSPLDALARHASNTKGKARASPQHLEAEERPMKRAQRNSTAMSAPAVPQSNNVPYPGSVAYFPYPTGQPSYQVSGPLIASGSSMATMPGQAVAWTQPIMSAGPMPAIGYPGFSASVTFSQPQFFASPPQPVPSAPVAVPTSDAWPQQYAAPPMSYKQPQYKTSVSGPRPSPHASSSSSVGRLVEHASALRKWSKKQASQIDSKEHLRRAFKSASNADVQKLRVKQKRQPKQPKQPKPQQQEPWIPDVDRPELRIPKKRGRPPRIRDASPPDVKPLANATETAIRIKTEEGAEMQPMKTATVRPTFDGSLPLASDRGAPTNREAHTLFIHSPRRLQWLARLAIVRAEQKTTSGKDAGPSVAETSQWARWSNSVAARLQHLRNEAFPINDEASTCASASQQTHSQSDPVGLFPREKRHAYVALRKDQHSAKRTASTRICIRKLLRYLSNTAKAAEGFDSRKEARAFLKDKHRADRLAKYMLKSTRPTALDLRRMWSVWARAAHARSLSKADVPDKQQSRVSFAPPVDDFSQQPKAGEGERGIQVKLEPTSPSITRFVYTPPRTAQVKQEPDSDGIATPLLPEAPFLGAASTTLSQADAERSPAAAVRTQAPLFLRRNFRVYQLLGLKDLPLS
ncbi:hypothetical protein EX895_000813 [Sporisorium graminicola]|uniref:Uncharacterized protein n=1 Tax=Sporisorium graminicola TaxID=280036 RepID=A0A4U7L0W8_9BASI|nr:hypothetical protein EX895_000813 [Sporisorium graminicola]TKY90815.1 hypothetical protein EX895_000813 [Sporisorium graminicola]